MPHYLGSTDYDHRTPERLGIVLVNLGTPDTPDTKSVRRYLAEFLSDPRVIEYPRWLWSIILHGIILRVRPRRSAHAYQQVWTQQGSPLLVNCQALTDKLGAQLRTQLSAETQVVLAMSYSKPLIQDALEQLRSAHVRKLIVLPLYPQYSGSTTGSVFDAVTTQLQRWRWVPALQFITQYHDDPAYIQALADSVRQHWQSHGKQHLLMSFHGLPKRYLLNGDPYHCQCYKTGRLVAEALQLNKDEWSVSFQSRVGREEWLRPYTDELLLRYAASGPKRVSVLCPGFAADCLETIEEIALRNREDFLKAGGASFDYIPALNDSAAHVAVLQQLITRHAQAWLPLDARLQTAPLAKTLGAAQ